MPDEIDLPESELVGVLLESLRVGTRGDFETR
jgi:hypothetical protein